MTYYKDVDVTDYPALQAEIADRVCPDYGCTACERMSLPPRGHGVPPGFAPAPDFCGYVKHCQPCSVRRPFGWVTRIPLDAFRKFVQEHADGAWAIDDMLPLVPPEQARGSSRFKWL